MSNISAAYYEDLVPNIFSAAVQRYGQPPTQPKGLGIRFGENGPQLFSLPDKNVVVLSLDATEQSQTGIYQLAHELIHVLNGTPKVASGLEEGVAITFAEEYVQKTLGAQARHVADQFPKYKRARDIVRAIEQNGCIWSALRQKTGWVLSGERITPTFIMAEVPSILTEDAEFLATHDSKFRR